MSKPNRPYLWLARFKPEERLLYGPDGKLIGRMKVNDLKTAAEYEYEDHQDAVVKPQTIHHNLRMEHGPDRS